MKAQRAKQTAKMEERFNRGFIIVCSALAIFTFARVVHREYRIGTDYTVNLNAVNSEVLNGRIQNGQSYEALQKAIEKTDGCEMTNSARGGL